MLSTIPSGYRIAESASWIVYIVERELDIPVAEHGLGYEINTCTKVTKGMPDLLAIDYASSSRIAWIFLVHNC
jgi:hypothetical protein